LFRGIESVNMVIVEQVLVLFFIMAAGFISRKVSIIDEESNRKLSKLLLYVTSPCLTIVAFNLKFSKDMLYNIGIILAFSVAIHLFSIIIGQFIYCKYPQNVRSVLKFITIYSNCGFMGFPILEGLYGKEGIFYGSIYMAVFNLFLWTNGIMIFTGKKDMKTIKKVLTNPGIIAVFLGMIVFLFSIKIPYPIFKAIDLIGSMTIPLSMIIVGARLCAVDDFKKLFSGKAMYYASIIRLIAIPAFVLAVLKAIGFDDKLTVICTMLVSMPAAANTVMFAELYCGDAELASRIVALTTLMSILTIPLLTLFF
jgi:predicted permease